MNKTLSEQDFINCANDLNVDIATIKAVFKVETGGKGGFIKDTDYPVILFEGHQFYKYLKQNNFDVDAISKQYPTLCYPKWTKTYYKTGVAEYNRYLEAAKINEECAMLATSWGLGQCMGFNYKLCGYNSIKDFVADMYISEYLQLKAFCNFIKSNTKMYNALKSKDWSTFAKLYNGPSYKQNKYDEKLKIAYDSYNK